MLHLIVGEGLGGENQPMPPRKLYSIPGSKGVSLLTTLDVSLERIDATGTITYEEWSQGKTIVKAIGGLTIPKDGYNYAIPMVDPCDPRLLDRKPILD